MRRVLSPSKVQRRTSAQVKKGKTPRQKIIKKLDDLVSKIVRARDGRCVVCGTTEDLQNGHLFSRASHSLRWDIRPDGNCHTQCGGCNLRHEYDFYPYSNWYIKKFGQEQYDLLYAEYRTVSKHSTSELEFMFEEMKREHKGEQAAKIPLQRPRLKAPIH